MKNRYNITCIIGVIVIAGFFYWIRHDNHKKTLNNAAAVEVSKQIDYKQTIQIPKRTDSYSLHQNNNQVSNFRNYQLEGSISMQQEYQIRPADNFHTENENISLYSTDETIRAFALRQLEDKQANRQILVAAVKDPSPKIRISALERIIELEDNNNRCFETDVNTLLDNEKDNNVIEAALSYYSMTNDEANQDVIQRILSRNDLTADVLSYAGEMLYDNFKMDKYDIYERISESPSFKKLEQYQIVQLQEELAIATMESSMNED